MYYLAIDLGASSGRGIVYYIENGVIKNEEVHRFKGYDLNAEFWDIDFINKNVEIALSNAYKKGLYVKYIGIDTWGVDYGTINLDKSIGQPLHYRNKRTVGMIDFIDENVISLEKHYQLSGISANEFNTFYQLYKGKKEGQLENVSKILFMPNLVGYYLTGEMATEPTIASTTAFYNKNTGYVKELLEKMEIEEDILPKVLPTHSILGNVKTEILKKLKINQKVKVVLTLGHDTAAAISAIPFDKGNNLFLSSGTWSLFGTLLKDYNFSIDALKEGYTNEVGLNNIRFLKNIIGFWIIQQCFKVWEADGTTKLSFDDIAEKLKNEKPSNRLINVMDKSFNAPLNMVEAIDNYLIKTKQLPIYDIYEYANCIYTSLALEYRYAKDGLEKISDKKFEKLYIFGGGSQNPIINQLTADSLQIKVLAGINEASSLGNFLSQAIASKELENYDQAKTLVKNTYSIKEYYPRENKDLDLLYINYKKYKKI